MQHIEEFLKVAGDLFASAGHRKLNFRPKWIWNLRIEITSQANTEHKQGDKFSIHINIIRPPFESVCFGRVYKTSATCAIKPQPVFFY
jgi:hypothetical protein